jgi:hypothetical protein
MGLDRDAEDNVLQLLAVLFLLAGTIKRTYRRTL